MEGTAFTHLHEVVDYPGGVSALVVMLLLGFLLVLAVSLTLWSALTLTPPPLDLRSPLEPEVAAVVPAPVRPTNDEVRGARATVRGRSEPSDDAFERFLRSDRRRDESEF